jgi:hypothetical protein
MKKRIFRVINICALLSISAAGCGAPSPVTTQASGKQRAAADDFQKVRPGDLLDAYLGVYVPTAVQARIDNTARTAARSCAIGSAPIELPTRSIRAQLRTTDRTAYRSAYGYGISAESADTAEQSDPGFPTPRTSSGPGPTDQACEQLIAASVDKLFPPAPMFQRSDELLQMKLSAPSVTRLADSWRACMSKAGYPTTESPMASRVIVEGAQLAAVARQGRDRPADGGEVIVVLPKDELTALNAFERSVFAADSACLASTGVGDALLTAEAEVLAQLRREYPNFPGVS